MKLETFSDTLRRQAGARSRGRGWRPASIRVLLAGLLLVSLTVVRGSAAGDAESPASARRNLYHADRLYHKDHMDQAETELRESVRLLEEEGAAAGASPTESDRLIDSFMATERKQSLAAALVALACVVQAKGEGQEAERSLRRAVEILASLPDPPVVQLVQARSRLAEVLERDGRVQEAGEVLLEAMRDQSRSQVERNRIPDNYLWKRRDRVLEKNGLFEDQLRQAIRAYEKAYGPDHIYVGRGVYQLALILDDKGNDREAEALYKRALAIHQGFLGPDHPAIAEFLTRLAALYRNRGDFDLGQSYMKKALAVYEEALQEIEPERLTALKNMTLRARLTDARSYLESIVEMEKKNFGPRHPNVGRSLRYLAMYLESEGKPEEAVAQYRQALEILQDSLGPEHPEVLSSMQSLAAMLHTLGQDEEAAALSRRLLDIAERQFGESHPLFGRTAYGLAIYSIGLGNREAADAYYQQALSVYEPSLGPDSPVLATLLQSMGENRIALGRVAEGESLQARAQLILGRQKPAEAGRAGKDCPLRKGRRAADDVSAAKGAAHPE